MNKPKLLLFLPIIAVGLVVVTARLLALPSTPDALVENLFEAMSQQNKLKIRLLCSDRAYQGLSHSYSMKQLTYLLFEEDKEVDSWDIWKKWADSIGVKGLKRRPKLIPYGNGAFGVSDRWDLFSLEIRENSRGWYLYRVQYAIGFDDLSRYKIDKPFIASKWK